MTRIALICDSTADLSPDDCEQLGARVVPLNIHFGNETLRDYVDITPARFLERLSSKSEMPRTSQPSPEAFRAAYLAAAVEHEAILVLTISSKLSGTWQSARLAASAAELHCPVSVIDTQSASIGLGLQVRRARDLIDSGLPLDEITESLERERPRYHLIFFADTLEYLQRGGRIGKASQLVGSILKIKPLLLCADGEVQPYEKTRSRSRAVEGIIEYARQFPQIARMAILHDGTTPDDVDRITAALADRMPRDKVITSQYGPTIASHVGPRALGLSVFEGPQGL